MLFVFSHISHLSLNRVLSCFAPIWKSSCFSAGPQGRGVGGCGWGGSNLKQYSFDSPVGVRKTPRRRGHYLCRIEIVSLLLLLIRSGTAPFSKNAKLVYSIRKTIIFIGTILLATKPVSQYANRKFNKA